MSDPVLALILIASFLVAAAGVRFFETLDSRFVAAAATPFVAGLIAGVVIRFFETSAVRAILTGLVLTAVTLYVRLTGIESEPVDGMLLGAVSGVAASLPLILGRVSAPLAYAECLLA